MPDSTETLVYINAPTLDNTDECTFVKNNDFLYATAGSEGRGDTADLVLYEKFIQSGCQDPLTAPDVPRNTFIPGRWAEQGHEAGSAGDYFIGNAVQVTAKAFNVGKVTQLKFRFYDKNTIKLDTQTLIKAQNLEDCTTKEEIIAALSDNTKNPGFVPKVALFSPIFTDGKWSGFKYICDAIIDTDNLPAEEDDWFVYNVEEDFFITPEMTTALRCGVAFVFLTNQYSSWDNVFNKNTVYTLQGASPTLRNKAADALEKHICARSVPRGSLDNVSYIVGDTTSTTEGLDSGQNRLIEFAFCMDVDLVSEYLKENAENHHLNLLDMINLNQIRYSAPYIETNDYETKLAAISECYVSHDSISRNNKIDCDKKKIHSISIPFKYSPNDSDYITSTMRYNQFATPTGGMNHTNRQIEISTEVNAQGEPINWIRSENIVSYSYFEEDMVYTFTFDRPIIYNNVGIFIRGVQVQGESGKPAIGIKVAKNDDGYYRYNSSDYVKFTNSSSTKTPCTPNVDILFDYALRKEWFDLVEKTQKDNADTLLQLIQNNTISIELLAELVNNNYKYLLELIEKNTTVVNTYITFLEDRIKFKWVELCENHSNPAKGKLYKASIHMSSNQWDAYSDPVYLCIYEKNDEGVFVKKAVSTNSLIPRRNTIESWSFQSVELTGKALRVGLLANPNDELAELGQPQLNPSLQTNAITQDHGYDGNCYVCNDNGVRQNFSCPIDFYFGGLDIMDFDEILETINNILKEIDNIWKYIRNLDIENEEINQTIQNIIDNITNITNEITNIKQDITNIKQDITNIEQDITNVTNEFNTKVENIEQNITNIEENITNIQQDITNIEENITNIEQNVTNVTNEFNTKIENIENKFETFEEYITNEITQIEQKFITIEEYIEVLEETIINQNIEIEQKFETINEYITHLEEYITNIEQNFTNEYITLEQKFETIYQKYIDLEEHYYEIIEKVEIPEELLQQITEITNKIKNIENKFVEIESKFIDVYKKFEEIDNSITEINTKFETIDNSITEINNKFIDINNKFEEIDNSITEINNKFETIDNSIVEINNKFEEIDNSITEINNKFETIDNSIVEINNKFIDVYKKFETIDNSITEINNKFETIDNSITEINNKFIDVYKKFEEINNDITEIYNKFETINQIIQPDTLNLGKWRIYVNAAGDLVIDTAALEAAGMSIKFKDIE